VRRPVAGGPILPKHAKDARNGNLVLEASDHSLRYYHAFKNARHQDRAGIIHQPKRD